MLNAQITFNVTHYYESVNAALDRLSGENRLNVTKFAMNVRRMFEDACERLSSQSEIYHLLIDSLFDKCGHKHKEACAVIVSYFVQRCEVFNEITE